MKKKNARPFPLFLELDFSVPVPCSPCFARPLSPFLLPFLFFPRPSSFFFWQQPEKKPGNGVKKQHLTKKPQKKKKKKKTPRLSSFPNPYQRERAPFFIKNILFFIVNSWGVWEGGREREIELRERKQNTERKNCLFFSFQNFGEREFGGQNGEEKKTPRKEQPQTFFSSLFNPPSVPWFFFTMNELERERAYGEKRERERL